MPGVFRITHPCYVMNGTHADAYRSDLTTFQSTILGFIKQGNFVASARSAYETIRAASPKERASLAVLGAEIIGFFTVGEIVGRRKLIGYRGEAGAHH